MRAKSRGGRSKGGHTAGRMRQRGSKGARAGEQCQLEHAPKMATKQLFLNGICNDNGITKELCNLQRQQQA